MHYNVIKNPSVFEEVEKRSKFISYSFKVNSEKEVQELIRKIKLMHPSARHHVYGYVFENVQKFSDDGEPSGTAGQPIMNVIKEMNLKKILIIIVRYFGGVLLGTGGLRRMYFSGAMNVVKKSELVKVQLSSEFLVICTYKQIGQISNLIANIGGKIFSTEYLSDVQIKFYIEKSLSELAKDKLINILKSKEKVFIVSENYHQI